MKVLLCHNHYLQAGGEDQVFADEATLLESRGVEVIRYVRDSKDTERMGPLAVVNSTLWNGETFDEVRALIQATRPDVMHCTNTFPLISPAVYDAAQVEHVPVVQSLHNFRTLCVNGLLMREGTPCEKCVGKLVPWRGVTNGCYRDSRAASAVLAVSAMTQRLKRASRDPVSLYVALSEFSRQKFLQGGFAPERVVVKPNFVSPAPRLGFGTDGGAVFVGRLSEEKGIDVLLDAWRRMEMPMSLTIVGDGPLAEHVQVAASTDKRIRWVGRQPLETIYKLLGDAAFLVLPSRCYENCPKTIIESYSCGTPAVVANQGAMQEMVKDGVTGRHFTAGDASHLASVATELFLTPMAITTMRQAARAEFEAKYTAKRNFEMMMELYDRAIGSVLQRVVAPESTAVSVVVPKPVETQHQSTS